MLTFWLCRQCVEARPIQFRRVESVEEFSERKSCCGLCSLFVAFGIHSRSWRISSITLRSNQLTVVVTFTYVFKLLSQTGSIQKVVPSSESSSLKFQIVLNGSFKILKHNWADSLLWHHHFETTSFSHNPFSNFQQRNVLLTTWDCVFPWCRGASAEPLAVGAADERRWDGIALDAILALICFYCWDSVAEMVSQLATTIGKE